MLTHIEKLKIEAIFIKMSLQSENITEDHCDDFNKEVLFPLKEMVFKLAMRDEQCLLICKEACSEFGKSANFWGYIAEIMAKAARELYFNPIDIVVLCVIYKNKFGAPIVEESKDAINVVWP
ncbi:MAG: hypothetical protein WCD31_08795 [Gillisia sp.]